MKKILCVLLAAAMLISCMLVLSGCNDKKPSDETTNQGEKPNKVSDSLTVNVGTFPQTIDPALNSAVDGGTYIIHAFSGLVGYEKNADGKLELFADCAKELPKAEPTADGKVQYVFTLKDDLKWSDGSALTAADFEYSWKRAVQPETAADYAYMFDVIDGYSKYAKNAEGNGAFDLVDGSYVDTKNTETTADGKTITHGEYDWAPELNVTASEDGKTLTVVLTVDVPYFLELCAFPTYMPVKQSLVEANPDGWATKAETYIGNGPYKTVEFTQSQIVMEKNEYYQGAADVVTNKLIFAFNGDDSSLLANYKNGSYLFIDSVPNDEIATLKATYPGEFFVEGQLGTYYVCFNVNDEAFKDFTEEERVDIRKALSLLIDRNYIVEKISQAGEVPASSYVAMGLLEPDGSEFISKNGVNGDGTGYFDVKAEDYKANCEEAMTLLKGVAESSGKFTVSEDNKLTGFPTLAYITNENTTHEAIATYLQGLYSGYGITMTVDVMEWSTFLETRKNGEYSVARNGWLSDYNDPISFLDMWISTSGNDDAQFGRGAHKDYAGYDGKTWAQSYDAIIAQVKASSDPTERFKLMHQAEDILMSTGAICPIYYYTDIFMCSKTINNFFTSPLGFKYFMHAYTDTADTVSDTTAAVDDTTADTSAAAEDTTVADTSADTSAAETTAAVKLTAEDTSAAA